jgi:ABC-type dipeptide/oligopeptide/nickel transport system permease subunit
LFSLVAHAEVRGIALAVIVALTGFAIGTPLGAAAALARGRFEPAVRTPSRVHLGFVFALTAWAPFARLALVQTRVLRDAAFIEAARALGASRRSVLARHVLPNLLGVVAVQLGSSGAAIVVSEAALAFVGLGPRDGVSLGAVMDQGVAAMLRAPHVLVVGSLAVFLTSAAMLLAGRAAEGRQR